MIRKIKEIDRPYIYDVIYKEFGYKYKQDSTFTNWLIFEDNNEIKGFINYDCIYDKAELLYIFVKEEDRNNNIATILLNSMILDLSKKNINEITLEVNEKNSVAIKFYKKNLFYEISRREKYYGNNDAILMFRSW